MATPVAAATVEIYQLVAGAADGEIEVIPRPAEPYGNVAGSQQLGCTSGVGDRPTGVRVNPDLRASVFLPDPELEESGEEGFRDLFMPRVPRVPAREAVVTPEVARDSPAIVADAPTHIGRGMG